jgi:ribosomal protein L15
VSFLSSPEPIRNGSKLSSSKGNVGSIAFSTGQGRRGGDGMRGEHRNDLGFLVEKKASKSLHNAFPKLSCFQAYHTLTLPPILSPNCLASKHQQELN